MDSRNLKLPDPIRCDFFSLSLTDSLTLLVEELNDGNSNHLELRCCEYGSPVQQSDIESVQKDVNSASYLACRSLLHWGEAHTSFFSNVGSYLF